MNWTCLSPLAPPAMLRDLDASTVAIGTSMMFLFEVLVVYHTSLLAVTGPGRSKLLTAVTDSFARTQSITKYTPGSALSCQIVRYVVACSVVVQNPLWEALSWKPAVS